MTWNKITLPKICTRGRKTSRVRVASSSWTWTLMLMRAIRLDLYKFLVRNRLKLIVKNWLDAQKNAPQIAKCAIDSNYFLLNFIEMTRLLIAKEFNFVHLLWRSILCDVMRQNTCLHNFSIMRYCRGKKDYIQDASEIRLIF